MGPSSESRLSLPGLRQESVRAWRPFASKAVAR
jgi:hypothetical protein